MYCFLLCSTSPARQLKPICCWEAIASIALNHSGCRLSKDRFGWLNGSTAHYLTLEQAPQHVPDDIGPNVQANRSKEAGSLEYPGGEDREQAVEQHNLYQQHGRDL